MDLATFKVTYPELASAWASDDVLVTAKLADAVKNVDTSTFGGTYDQAHGLFAAHLICLSPGGQFARLDPKALGAMGASRGLQTTTYGLQFLELRNAATTALRVF